MDDAVDELVGGKTAGEIKASIRPEELQKVENGLIKDKRAELAASIEEQVTKSLKAQGYSGDTLATKTREEVKKIMDQQFPESQLRRMVKAEFSPQDIQRMALQDRIYNKVYHGEFPEKIANVDQKMQAGYEQKLNAAKGPQVVDRSGNVKKNLWHTADGKGLIRDEGYWQHRFSTNNGNVGLDPNALKSGEDIRRFYFNLKPENAAEFADYMTTKLNAENISWQYKMPQKLKNFDRPDAGVLYVEKADYQAVKRIAQDYAKDHPEAFAGGTPGFTKAIGSGIGVADEPLQTYAKKVSFGELRSEIIADETLKAKPGATAADIQAAVRSRMQKMGLDPDKPWLQRRGPDDL
jgi:hypothetical protein